MREKSLALGIDIGATRLRIAAVTCSAGGPLIRKVVTREIPAGYATSGEIAKPDYVAALIYQAVEELDTHERRCISSVGAPAALLCAVPLCGTSSKHRKRLALEEAQSQINYPLRNAVVKSATVEPRASLLVLGVVHKAVLHSRVLTLKKAGMKVLAIDHEALALRRALPRCTVVADVGHERASVHWYGAVVPRTVPANCGGAEVTRAIEADLSIDPVSAEKRKCKLGTLGAGEAGRAALTLRLVQSIDVLREAKHEVPAITLVGNGSRLTGLAAEVANITGVRITTADPAAVSTKAYPSDVLRDNAMDWALAVGLSLWQSGSKT